MGFPNSKSGQLVVQDLADRIGDIRTILQVGVSHYSDDLVSCFEAAKVYCFDPDKRPKLVSSDRVVRVFCAAGRSDRSQAKWFASHGTVPVSDLHKYPGANASDFFGSSSLIENQSIVTSRPWITFTQDIVQSRSVDSWAKENGLIDSVDLVWIDANGSELDVLYGARELLKHCKCLVIKAFDSRYSQRGEPIKPEYPRTPNLTTLSESVGKLRLEQFTKDDFATFIGSSCRSKQMPEPKRLITMKDLGRMGQWGNQVIQYAFVRCMAEQNNVEYQVPEWGGQYLFGFEDKPISKELKDYKEQYYKDWKRRDCVPIPPLPSEMIGKNFVGYAQFDTGYYSQWKDKIQSLFSFPAEPQASRCYPIVEELKRRGKTIIGLHLRRGDSGRLVFPFTPISWCLQWLHDNWARFPDPVLFVATEDSSLLNHFASYKPVTISDFGVELSSTSYPGYQYPYSPSAKQVDFFPDWFVLKNCDIILASDSTFSITAAWTSTDIQELWRPKLSLGKLVQEDPWDMHFINREHLDDYPGIPGTQIDENPKYWINFKPKHKSAVEDLSSLSAKPSLVAIKNPEPMITCICSSYNRPRLLGQSIAMFLAQDYVNKQLVVLEDSGVFGDKVIEEGQWKIVSTTKRFPSVAHKRNWLVQNHCDDFIAVWDDDDWYLPWHLSAASKALHRDVYVQPRQALEWNVKPNLSRHEVFGKPVLQRMRNNCPITSRDAIDCCYGGQWSMRKFAFSESGGYPEQHGNGEDTIWCGQMFNLFGPSGNSITQELPPSYIYSRTASGSWHASDMGPGLAYQEKTAKMAKRSVAEFEIKLPDVYLQITKESIPENSSPRMW